MNRRKILQIVGLAPAAALMSRLAKAAGLDGGGVDAPDADQLQRKPIWITITMPIHEPLDLEALLANSSDDETAPPLTPLNELSMVIRRADPDIMIRSTVTIQGKDGEIWSGHPYNAYTEELLERRPRLLSMIIISACGAQLDLSTMPAHRYDSAMKAQLQSLGTIACKVPLRLPQRTDGYASFAEALRQDGVDRHWQFS
jgi:hypothetical protein